MTLNIFGLQYKVARVKEMSQGGGVAEVNYEEKLINILADQKGKAFDECLIHEIIHAVFDRIGVGSTKLHPDFEEIICDSIAKVISDNFKLVKRQNAKA